jgi:hypothetical protein
MPTIRRQNMGKPSKVHMSPWRERLVRMRPYLNRSMLDFIQDDWQKWVGGVFRVVLGRPIPGHRVYNLHIDLDLGAVDGGYMLDDALYLYAHV